MSILQDILAAVGWQTRVNENFRSVSAAGLYGIDPVTTTGLTLGFKGGEFNGVSVNDGTVALTASNTNYVVAHRTTGVVTAAITNTDWNNTTVYLRLYELVAGASTFTIAVTSDKRQTYGVAASAAWGSITGSISSQTDLYPLLTQVIPIACSDETTSLTAGVAKVTFRMPYGFTLLAGAAGVRASVTTAPTGSVLTVDINENGSSILSTKLTIDATEKTSTTAATPAVISDVNLADDAEITIDIDGVGSTIAGAGLKVYLIGVKA